MEEFNFRTIYMPRFIFLLSIKPVVSMTNRKRNSSDYSNKILFDKIVNITQGYARIYIYMYQHLNEQNLALSLI